MREIHTLERSSETRNERTHINGFCVFAGPIIIHVKGYEPKHCDVEDDMPSWIYPRKWVLGKSKDLNFKKKKIEAYQGCQAWEDFKVVAMIELVREEYYAIEKPSKKRS